MYCFNRNSIFCLISILILFSSCVVQHDIEYLQDKNKGIKVFSEAQIEDYKLKPNDELYIKISSLDDAAASIFSGTGVQPALYMSSIQPYGASLMSYTIDKEGYLHLPIIGSILVRDKTLTQVSNLLKESLTNILSQPIVTVKLVNRYVSVLGEVRNPGHFAYAQDKLTVYDAIGLAGDITDYGNRDNVILIRSENGNNIRININLAKSDILASNYYYLRPNDILYVKPLRRKFWAMRQFPFAIVLSTISTAILVYSIIQ